MFRNLLGVVAALALPSVLVGQAPTPPNPAAGLAKSHGVAMQIQGEVVGAPSAASGVDVANNQEGPDEANGENNDGDVENGELNQEGVDEPDGLNNDVEVGDQVDQGGEQEDVTQDGTPAPPPGTAQVRMIGRHRP
jgi:hypothetical protein